MPITKIQKGLCAQNDFFKFLIIGGGGLIEIAAPSTDDERRDGEIHRRGEYGNGIAAQFKSTSTLIQKTGTSARYLSIRCPVQATRVVNNPRFWYFIGYLDLKVMGVVDPVFVIPSSVFHREASPGRKGKLAFFSFIASMKPESRDKWTPYRFETRDLGRRVLEIMDELAWKQRRSKRLLLSPPIDDPHVIWLRKAA